MKRIAVLGNNSGRNAGDNAILGNLLRDVSAQLPDVEFLIPTTNVGFVQKQFGQFNVRPVGMMPWNGCIKNLGLPLYRTMTAADVVLICDNILFDRKFFNPLFNYLSSVALFAPACKKRGIPIVLYNASVGPVDSPIGIKALRTVLEATTLAVVRDQDTPELFRRLNLPCPELHVHADCALNTEPPPKERMDALIAQKGIFGNPKGTVGFNVNAYIDNWSTAGAFSREAFCASIAEAADRVTAELGVDVLFFVTQVMDAKITQECVDRISRPERVKTVSCRDLTYEELAALLGRVEVHCGLRTHSLIFCAAMCTPAVGIVSYPKSAAFLRTVGQGRWLLPFDELSASSLAGMIGKAWQERDGIREELARIVPKEKEKARLTAALLKKCLTGNRR